VAILAAFGARGSAQVLTAGCLSPLRAISFCLLSSIEANPLFEVLLSAMYTSFLNNILQIFALISITH